MNILLEKRNELIKIYDTFDKGHRFDHIEKVITNATIINSYQSTKYSVNIIYLACLYHDIGLSVNRDNHHMESANILRNDKDLRKIFTDEEIELAAKACEEHRASYKGEFTSLLSKIINDADSADTIEDMIKRSYYYTKALCENESEIYEKVFKHLKEKYGRNGYCKYKLQETYNIPYVKYTINILDNEYLFKRIYTRVIIEERIGE